MDDDEQRQRVTDALLKVLVFSVILGLVFAGGAYLLINAVGLGSPGGPSATTAGESRPSLLPTVALKTTPAKARPKEDKGSAAESQPSASGIRLSASPTSVAPLQRINLTGSYPGKSSLSLQVQRYESGQWVDFPVTASVSGGSFGTYVMTSHTGTQKFRVYDAGADKASNAVSVSVG